MKRQGDQLSQESPSTGVRRIRPHTVRNPRINSQPALCIQALPSADSTNCRPCSMYLLGKKKNPYISGPTQFKPTFMGLLHWAEEKKLMKIKKEPSEKYPEHQENTVSQVTKEQF